MMITVDKYIKESDIYKPFCLFKPYIPKKQGN